MKTKNNILKRDLFYSIVLCIAIAILLPGIPTQAAKKKTMYVVTELKVCYSDGLFGPIKFTYNKNGFLTSQKATGEDGWTTKYSYNKNHHLSTTVTKCPGGYKATEKYTYNKKGQLVKNAFSSSRGTKRIYQYTWKKNQLIKMTINKNQSVAKYSYNSKGFIAKEKISGSDNMPGVKNFSYDKQGNLKKIGDAKYKMVYKKGKPVKLVYEPGESNSIRSEYKCKKISVPAKYYNLIVQQQRLIRNGGESCLLPIGTKEAGLY